MKGQDNSNPNTIQNGLKPQVSILVVPFPAQGHLNQLLHLSHLISSYGLPVHYAGSTIHNRQAKLRLEWAGSLGNHVQFHDFELPPYDSPPPNPNPSMFSCSSDTSLGCYNASPRTCLRTLKKMSNEYRRVIVIYETVMAYVVQDVGKIVNVESYCFVPCGAVTVFLGQYDMINRKLPFEIDSDVLPSNIPSNEGCFPPEMTEFIAQKVRKYSGLQNGSLYNTSRVIEGRYVELLERLSNKKCYTKRV